MAGKIKLPKLIGLDDLYNLYGIDEETFKGLIRHKILPEPVKIKDGIYFKLEEVVNVASALIKMQIYIADVNNQMAEAHANMKKIIEEAPSLDDLDGKEMVSDVSATEEVN